MYALLDPDVYLRQAGAHVDCEEELDGEVLSPDLTMFGGNTDELACGADTTLRLWLGITHGVLLVVTPDYSPDSPRSSHTSFHAYFDTAHANIRHFCGVDRAFRSMPRKVDFHGVTTILVTRLESLVGHSFIPLSIETLANALHLESI